MKAGDISSVGSFKTSTINALQNVVDENGDGFFPSATTVSRTRHYMIIMAWKWLVTIRRHQIW